MRYVRLALEAFERRAEKLEPVSIAHVDEALVVRPPVVQVLRRRDQLEELDDAGLPARDVVRDFLQGRQGALAPPQANRIGDLGPPAERGAFDRHLEQPAHPNQIPDVGNDPLSARLDKEIVVRLIQLFLDDRDLLRHYLDQRPQWPALTRVLHPVRRGEQGVQPFCVEYHQLTPRLSGRGSNNRSCAGKTSPRLPVTGTSAVNRWTGDAS